MSYEKRVFENERRARAGWSDVRTLDPARARRVMSECNRVLAAKRQAPVAETTEAVYLSTLVR